MYIKEMAARTGITEETLRYYERIGIMPPVPRKAGGVRNYSEYHIQYMALIRSLKSSGMTLDDIQQYMILAKAGDDTAKVRKNMLCTAKNNLLKKIAYLQYAVQEADFQISHYETSLLHQTDRLMQELQ